MFGNCIARSITINVIALADRVIESIHVLAVV